MIHFEHTVPWVLVAAGFHNRGGMDKANLALAEYLLDQGTPVHVVCHHVDDCLAKRELATIHVVSRPVGSFFLGEPLLDLAGRTVARRITRQWSNAHIVVNGGNCIWPGINWAHYVHHAWQSQNNRGPWWYEAKRSVNDMLAKRRERAAFQRARLVISNSEVTSRHIVEYFQVDRRRVHTVYLGSDPEWGPVTSEERDVSRRSFQITDSRPLVAFVGALGYDHRKGFDTLFAAWQRLCAKPDWDADLLVAGTGRILPVWRSRASEARLTNRIRILGFSDQIRTLLAAVDLLVSPVRYEAYGLNVQEAICRGVPAMVSTSAGIAERYEGDLVPLLISDPENISDLVERLLAWRSKKEEWLMRFRPFGAKLRSRTWRDMAADIVSITQEHDVCKDASCVGTAEEYRS